MEFEFTLIDATIEVHDLLTTSQNLAAVEVAHRLLRTANPLNRAISADVENLAGCVAKDAFVETGKKTALLAAVDVSRRADAVDRRTKCSGSKNRTCCVRNEASGEWRRGLRMKKRTKMSTNQFFLRHVFSRMTTSFHGSVS